MGSSGSGSALASDVGKPWIRLSIVIMSVIALGIIARTHTGNVLPSNPDEAILFQNALLLVVLGSALLEPHFTRPAEGLVNSLTALITLIAVYPTAPRSQWILIAALLVFVLASSIVCVAMQGREPSRAWHRFVARSTYRVAVTLGRARIVFSAVFLSAVAFFVKEQNSMTLSLLAFWAAFIAIWPLGIPQFLSSLTRETEPSARIVGRVDRVDSPGIVRAALSTDDRWRWGQSRPLLVHMQDHSTSWGVPVVSEDRSDGRWGTLLLAGQATGFSGGKPGTIERPTEGAEVPAPRTLFAELTGSNEPDLIGFVREGSSVSSLKIEVLPEVSLQIGQLLFAPTSAGNVYYQITHAETAEEAFKGLNYGSHGVEAAQVGRLGEGVPFSKYPWLPAINAPVFLATEALGAIDAEDADDLFTLGSIPGTGMNLKGDFVNNLETHTAILGVTGSGKTEFAIDLVRHAAEQGVKVVCIDLTAQYADRLSHLEPRPLSIADDLASELSEKLFAAETGAYGAGDEKKALKGFASRVRSSVDSALHDFVQDDDVRIGLVELREIANTKATLWITETYLSAILRMAREGGLGGQRLLIVVEEAHTVMPEPSFLGLGDYESKGIVAKISQIALQGRKYGVGLLVLAQRTATVSKSVLTQCNTVVSFSCIDDTSINFLRNVYGNAVASTLPDLPHLRAVAHGAWIRSEGPIVFDVPFDEVKAEAKIWAPTRPGAGDTSNASGDLHAGSDEPPF